MKLIKDINIIKDDYTNLEKDNLLPQINEILNNIPSVSPIEKVRYIYIKLGEIFSYDYRVAYDQVYIDNKKIDFNSFIGKYQTCIQISKILNYILNKIDGVKCTSIERKANIRGQYGESHIANEVTIKINDKEYETYILDLTLDLYLIQSKCRTLHFGYESIPYKNYDIIPQSFNYEMDKKLNLNYNYTDFITNKLNDYFRKKNYSHMSDEERIKFKLDVYNSIITPTSGYHEGKQFLTLLFIHTLNCYFKEYNLFLKENEESFNLKTIYKIELNSTSLWIIYSNKLGIMLIDKELIKEMINNGFETRSNSLEEELLNKSL